ncbi:YidC/Oxa1 family membrane protein insertase [Scatolibacter rhodanostii]|uniref:YidC/Oxa1 family membrane protein insertase n=1 Tax=Scatolibacter rhodanostii TaxID=2014781 RepID=UPI000C0893D3|nr:YidC/Oxa1 family membrane protein insertase [Scatolibacter rhodanostii]
MGDIFNLIGGLLGYLLWALFAIFKNYGVAIIFFTILTKLILFPSTLKQQRGMASQSKFAKKQAELQKIYGNNKQKYNEELMKLQEKEGINPMGGCLPMLLTFPVMIGVMYSVSQPLSNTLHIAKDTIAQATQYVSRIPGSGNMGYYAELEILRNFGALQDKLTMFTPADVEKITELSKGFNFLGLDLLQSPEFGNWSNILWILPVGYLLVSIASQIYMQRSNPAQAAAQGQQKGCMGFMMYGMNFFFAYLAFSYPAAVSLYFIAQSITSTIQTAITNQFFSIHHMTAKSEAQRAVTLALAEEKINPLSADAQRQIAKKLDEAAINQPKDNKKKTAQKGTGKKSSGKSRNSDQYLGSKK